MKKAAFIIVILIIASFVWATAFADVGSEGGSGNDGTGVSDYYPSSASQTESESESESDPYNPDAPDEDEEGIHNIYDIDADNDSSRYDEHRWENDFKWLILE